MTVRNALVSISGRVQEMPAGDTLNGAAGGSTGIANSITTTLTVAAGFSYLVVRDFTVGVGGSLVVNGDFGVL